MSFEALRPLQLLLLSPHQLVERSEIIEADRIATITTAAIAAAYACAIIAGEC